MACRAVPGPGPRVRMSRAGKVTYATVTPTPHPMALAGLRVVEASVLCFDELQYLTIGLVRWSSPSPVCWINPCGQWCFCGAY